MLDLIPWPVVAFLLGLAAVLAIVIYFDRQRERERLEQLTSWAASLGFTIQGGSRALRDAGLDADLVSLPVFQRGRGHRVRNVIRGRGLNGAELVFDYRYTTQSGKHSATFEQTVAAFEYPDAALPAFDLRPEGIFARIGQALGDPDIDFDSNPEFSRKYQLRGRDVAAVTRLFERQAVVFLGGTENWSIEGRGSWILAFAHNRRQKVEDLTAFLGDARTVVRAIIGR